MEDYKLSDESNPLKRKNDDRNITLNYFNIVISVVVIHVEILSLYASYRTLNEIVFFNSICNFWITNK